MNEVKLPGKQKKDSKSKKKKKVVQDDLDFIGGHNG